MTLVESHQVFSREVPGSCHSEALVSNYQNVGLEFSLDQRMLFIVNPNLDRLEVLTLPNHGLNTLPGTPILVGDFPVDVTVVRRNRDPNQEMAYTVNRYAQTVSQIDITSDSFTSDPDITPFPPASNRYFVAIDARSDGKRLFTANWTHQSVGVVNIDPDNPLAPFWVTDIGTAYNPNEGFPTRLVLLRLAEPEPEE